MSMPVATYQCTACELSCWDAGTWGYRYYVYGETKLRLRVAMGWCPSCKDLNAVEVLPDAAGELLLQRKLQDFQAELDVIVAAAPKKRFWLFQPRKSTRQRCLEGEIESAAKGLAEYQLTRAALSARQSQARCLRCGAEGCNKLPPHEVDYLGLDASPVPIGFVHPGCGGQITIACDGMRLNVSLTDKAYDLEGRQVNEIET